MSLKLIDVNENLLTLKEEANRTPNEIGPYLHYLNYKTAWRGSELQRSWKSGHFFAYVFIKNRTPSQVSLHVQVVKDGIKEGKNHIFYLTVDIFSGDQKERVSPSVVDIKKREIKAMLTTFTKGNFTFDRVYAVLSKRIKEAMQEDISGCVVIQKISAVIYDDLSYLSDIADKVEYDIAGRGFHLISVNGSIFDIEIGEVNPDVYTIPDREGNKRFLKFCKENIKLLKKMTPGELLKVIKRLNIGISRKSRVSS